MSGGPGEPGPPVPPPAGSDEPPAVPARRGPIVALVVVLALVAVATGIGIFVATRGPSGPPLAPAGLNAESATCAPPSCDRISSKVTLTWRGPTEGPEVTGYVVYRDGARVREVGAAATSYTDDTVTFGETYSYRVQAIGADGRSPQSEEVKADTPLPPISAAQLNGSYRVMSTVRAARNLGKLEGINNPVPGDSSTATWTFTSTCSADEGACPTKWFGHAPPLRPMGKVYAGSTTEGPSADCFSGGHVKVKDSFRIVVRKASKVGTDWGVAAFAGTHTIVFRCPGARPSVGTLEIEGHFSG